MSTDQQLAKSSNGFTRIAKYINGDQVKAQIARVLPRFVNAEEITRVCLNAVQKNPMLLECTPESLCMELMRLGEMGLKPNGYEAHLVPFKEYNRDGSVKRINVVGIADWKGLVKLMYRSGMIVSVMAKAVRTKDKFSYRYGFGAFLEHEPHDSDTLDGRGQLKAAWAMAQLKDGGTPFVVLGRAEVLSRKAASRGAKGDNSPWVKYEDAMWAKSAVRELSKFVPLAPELEQAIERDAENEYADESIVDVSSSIQAALEDQREELEAGEPSRADALADKLLAGKTVASQPEPQQTAPKKTAAKAPAKAPKPAAKDTAPAEPVKEWSPPQDEEEPQPAQDAVDEEPAEPTMTKEERIEYQTDLISKWVAKNKAATDCETVDAEYHFDIETQAEKFQPEQIAWCKKKADEQKAKILREEKLKNAEAGKTPATQQKHMLGD